MTSALKAEGFLSGLDVATTLGVLGFLLAVWNLVRDRPRVDAQVGMVMLGSTFQGIWITVINTGPVGVSLSGLSSDHTPLPGTLNGYTSHSDPSMNNDFLPCVVPAHSVATWRADAEWTRSALSAQVGTFSGNPAETLELSVEWFRPRRP